jgi:hypothetical protein
MISIRKRPLLDHLHDQFDPARLVNTEPYTLGRAYSKPLYSLTTELMRMRLHGNRWRQAFTHGMNLPAQVVFDENTTLHITDAQAANLLAAELAEDCGNPLCGALHAIAPATTINHFLTAKRN